MLYIVQYYTGDCCCRTDIDRVFTIEAQAEGYLNKQAEKKENKGRVYFMETREIW